MDDQVFTQMVRWATEHSRRVEIHLPASGNGITITNAYDEGLFEGWPPDHNTIVVTEETLPEAWRAFTARVKD